MERRIAIRWTETALNALRQLPRKAARGLLSKADDLRDCTDPRTAHKPLLGPLQGCYRITYGRYRAIYKVEEEQVADGEVVIHVEVWFIAAGIRKARDRRDIYRIAQKLVESGLLDLDEESAD